MADTYDNDMIQMPEDLEQRSRWTRDPSGVVRGRDRVPTGPVDVTGDRKPSGPIKIERPPPPPPVTRPPKETALPAPQPGQKPRWQNDGGVIKATPRPPTPLPETPKPSPAPIPVRESTPATSPGFTRAVPEKDPGMTPDLPNSGDKGFTRAAPETAPGMTPDRPSSADKGFTREVATPNLSPSAPPASPPVPAAAPGKAPEVPHQEFKTEADRSKAFDSFITGVRDKARESGGSARDVNKAVAAGYQEWQKANPALSRSVAGEEAAKATEMGGGTAEQMQRSHDRAEAATPENMTRAFRGLQGPKNATAIRKQDAAGREAAFDKYMGQALQQADKATEGASPEARKEVRERTAREAQSKWESSVGYKSKEEARHAADRTVQESRQTGTARENEKLKAETAAESKVGKWTGEPNQAGAGTKMDSQSFMLSVLIQILKALEKIAGDG